MPKNEYEAQKKNAWIIDDNELYKKNLISLINELPDLKCIKSFDTCEEAISQLINAWEPEIILVDLGLHKMSGLEGIQKLKNISPGSQIIILTVYEDNDKVFAALCAGASGYLIKSSTIDKIIEVINDVLHGGIVMNPPIAKKVFDILEGVDQNEACAITDKEKQILELMVKGLTKRKIANQLLLSFQTIDTHLRSIFCKLHAYSRSSAMVKSFLENKE